MVIIRFEIITIINTLPSAEKRKLMDRRNLKMQTRLHSKIRWEYIIKRSRIEKFKRLKF